MYTYTCAHTNTHWQCPSLVTSHRTVNSNQAVSRTAISRDKGQGEEWGGVEGEMEGRDAGMEQAGRGATKGSGSTQGRRPRAADVSVCACVCAQHWGGGKWECEREAGRVGPAAPLGSSWGGERTEQSRAPSPHTTRGPDRQTGWQKQPLTRRT